jgi:hypothetical protein
MLRVAQQRAAEVAKTSSEIESSSTSMIPQQLEAAIARRREANKIAHRLQRRSSSQYN